MFLAACSQWGYEGSRRAQAQAISELPRTEYYVAKELFGAGRIEDASEGFNAALLRARKIGERAWIDSIPPLVMLGECYYQQGNLARALEQYDAALQLALVHPLWIEQFDVGLEQLPEFDMPSKGIDWFQKSIASRSVIVPEGVQITIDPTQGQAVPGGGVVAPAGLVTRLDATEVLRGLGVAMLRRWQVLGPLAVHSPLSEPVARLFDRAPSQRAAWVNSAWTVLRGISQLSTPTFANSPTIIRSGVLLGNQFDYFMSPLALISLAEIDAQRGNLPAAIAVLQDASLLAARYEQHGELAASLGLLASCAAAGRRTDILEPLRNAAAWCVKRSNLSGIAATVGAAELAVYANNFTLADRLIGQVIPTLGSRDIALPRAQAHADFTSALIAFGQNRGVLGRAKLDNALKFVRGSAQTGAVVETVFQAQLTLNLLAEGRLSAVDAEDLLLEVLDEPSAAQWQLSPLKTLASITTARMPAYERLLDLAEMRGDQPAVVARLDRLQRERFYESLPQGGRLLCWRQALTAQSADLPPDVGPSVERTQLNYPSLQASIARMETLVEQLRQGRLPLDERQLPLDLKKMFTELSDLSEAHENQLVFQSLLRKPLPRYLPAAADFATLQKSLQAGDLLLALAATRQRIIGIAITSESLETWQVSDVAGLAVQLQGLFSNIGLVSSELPKLPSTVLAVDAAWVQHAREINDLLFPPSVQFKIEQAKRLQLAPHGQLWYLPFELLPLNSTPEARPWIEGRTITYIPTLGSLPNASAARPDIRQTVGLINSFFSIDKESNKQQAQQVVDAVSNSTGIFLDQKVTVPSPVWLRLHCDQFWLAAHTDSSGSGLETVVMPFGKPTPATISSWLRSPGHAPASVILPAMQSSIQNGNLGNGDEIFLPACGLLASGVKTAVISRWPVGGKSTSSLLVNYLQELQTESSAEALRRATLSLWAQDFLVADEPGLLPAGKEAAALTRGNHPTLWAAYMAIGDTRPPAPDVASEDKD